MMKKYFYFAIAAVIAIVMTGCGFFPETTPTYTENDIVGRWEASSQLGYADPGDKIVFVFLNETCTNAGTTYGKWGYTYDEGDNSTEKEQLTTYYHGNGWFGWELQGGDIQTYQMFTSSDAISPYKYKIHSLEGNTMVLEENGSTYTLTKVQ